MPRRLSTEPIIIICPECGKTFESQTFKKYCQECGDIIKKQKHKISCEKYSKNNLKKVRESKKNWKLRNPEKVKEEVRNRYNKTSIGVGKTLHRICPTCNKSFLVKVMNQTYCSKKCNDSDPKHIIRKGIRSIKHARLKSLSLKIKSEKLLDKDSDVVRKHFENQFQEGMTWKNYGRNGWVQDHYVPFAWFLKDTNLPELSLEQKLTICMHYLNVQPLWEKDNVSKSDKLPHDYLERINTIRKVLEI